MTSVLDSVTAPREWHQTKLRSFLRRRKQTNCPNLRLLSVNLPSGVVPRQDGDGRVAPSLDLRGYQEVRPSDLVMNQLGKPHGAIGVSDYHGIISPAYFVAEISNKVDPRFVHHLLRTRLYISEYERRGKCQPPSQFDISWEQFRDIGVALPPLSEQRTIAGYLDTETARIDALISKKRHLIHLLAEYRTALITQTVTHGLDPTVPHRPSGIDWLGDIPSHWQVRRLRKVCEFAYGDSLPSESRLEGKVPVFGSNGVVGHHNEANTLAPVIVIGRKGSHGEVNFHDASVFAIDTTYFVDARHTSVDLRWLYFGLLCVDLADESMDSAVPGLSREHAYGKYLPVPPIAEQREIADYLDIETARIDALVSRIRSAIMLLEEYRSALITAAVTGEFDVPNRDTSVEEQ